MEFWSSNCQLDSIGVIFMHFIYGSVRHSEFDTYDHFRNSTRENQWQVFLFMLHVFMGTCICQYKISTIFKWQNWPQWNFIYVCWHMPDFYGNYYCFAAGDEREESWRDTKIAWIKFIFVYFSFFSIFLQSYTDLFTPSRIVLTSVSLRKFWEKNNFYKNCIFDEI